MQNLYPRLLPDSYRGGPLPTGPIVGLHEDNPEDAAKAEISALMGDLNVPAQRRIASWVVARYLDTANRPA